MGMEIIKELKHLLVTMFLTGLASFIVIPAITDVTIAALCPSQPNCSLAIFLSGFQQAVTAVGAVVMTPLIGNLSDQYGRRALLTVPLTVSIIPLGFYTGRRASDSSKIERVGPICESPS